MTTPSPSNSFVFIGPRSYSIVASWQAKDSWKNDILIRLQQKLIALAPDMPFSDRTKFVQQLVQENGGLDPLSITGDYGRAYGLGQWESSSARRMRSRIAVKTKKGTIDQPAELERQLTQLAGEMVSHWREFPGDIRRAIAVHNGPSKIRAGAADSCRSVRGRGWSCYYRDEVDASSLVALFTTTIL